jgi:hypothetical protein
MDKYISEEHRLRNLERRVAELETIAATPVFIHTKGVCWS